MAGALDGIRVIDFGQYVAGPLAGMLLADQGADVIRVEPPGGPKLDTPANRVWNRGKRGIVLDLHAAADRAVARDLVDTADVVVENFRPGVMDRFGLGPAEVTASNPRVIYCSMPGFASDDPRRGVAAWEGVVAAATATVGRAELDGPAANGSSHRPVYGAIPVSSAFAAFWGVVSITMALNARQRDGVGQIIEAPLFDSTFTALGVRAQRAQGDGAARTDLRTMGIRRFGSVLAGAHLCRDGRWVYVHPGNKNIGDLMRATGADRWTPDDDTPSKVKDLFLGRSAREWEDLGAEVETEVVECRSALEWIRSEHPTNSRMVVEVLDEVFGPMLQPGLQVMLDASPGEVRPARSADADREAIVPSRVPAAAGAAAAAPTGVTPMAVLAGKKVLDLCIVLAGPTCGRTLAEFGADVIKIERPPRPGVAGPGRVATPLAFNIDINRGKRSLVIDLKSPHGLEVFWRLVDDADVVVQNFRLGVAEKLGFGYEQVRARRPDIVYASLNMYGYDGPWAGRPGHEQLGQHGTGLSVRYGGGAEPQLQHAGAVNDYGTGLMGAYAVALALFHRQRTGEGQHVTTSLAQTAQILQSPYFYDYAGRGPWTEPAGQGAWGESAVQRFYATNDAWVFLGAHYAQVATLATVDGLEGLPVEADDAALTTFLTDRLANDSAEAWSKRLVDAGVGVHPVARLEEVMQDAWVRDHELVVSMPYDGIGLVDQTGPPPRLSRTPVRVGNPAPAPGADGREILLEHGLDPEALAATGGVVIGEAPAP